MDSGVANPGNMMLCPDCRAENIEGEEVCEACGADLSALKLPSAASELEEHLIQDRLGEVGAPEALDVAPGDPVFLAVHFMRDKNIECVLVRDEDGNIVGILTERDILLKAAGAKQDLMAMAVKDIMSPDPVMLREGDTLAVAMHKMSVGGFRHIPFVAGDGTTLLVSIQDVFRHVAEFIPRD
ncbi:MAG: CBS domain-containing protein [Chloroflexi bacterium]|nr:CBS domain-containing protein [Chloroflexota bacterium]